MNDLHLKPFSSHVLVGAYLYSSINSIRVNHFQYYYFLQLVGKNGSAVAYPMRRQQLWHCISEALIRELTKDFSYKHCISETLI